MSLGFQIVLWSAVGRVYAVPQPCRSPISVVSRSVESTQSLNLVVCPFLWSACRIGKFISVKFSFH